MMGKDHRNYQTSAGLVEELKESFTIDHPNYLMALSINFPYEKKMAPGMFAPFTRNDYLLDFLANNDLLVKNTYENPFLFHYLTVFYSRQMFDFFETYIRPKRKMFIGSTPRDVAERLYGTIHHYIQIPAKHAYNSIDSWWPHVENNINDVELVIPSAGAASNVISKRLWNMNAQVHLLDIGSIVDAIEGKHSRIWVRIQGHKIKKILPKDQRNGLYPNSLKNSLNDLKYLYRRYIKKYLK